MPNVAAVASSADPLATSGMRMLRSMSMSSSATAIATPAIAGAIREAVSAR